MNFNFLLRHPNRILWQSPKHGSPKACLSTLVVTILKTGRASHAEDVCIYWIKNSTIYLALFFFSKCATIPCSAISARYQQCLEFSISPTTFDDRSLVRDSCKLNKILGKDDLLLEY